MHGHLPQQHPGMHPASHHQPPPHLTHLANLPPHSIPREHHASRLNTARHHHPRGVDHQTAGGMAPHLPMQVPPPPHQSQNPRKPPGPTYYANGGIHGGGLPKPLPMTAAHMHPPPPPPPGMSVGQPQPHPSGPMPLQSVVGGKLPYGMGGMGPHGGGKPMQQQQQQQQQPPHQPPVSVHHSVAMAPPVQAPIPVVSAATPAGTKTRHIPSSTDHKIHHHSSQHSMQSNGGGGSSGPGSKGTMMHHQPMDKPKVGSNRHQQQQAHPSSQQMLKATDSAHPAKDVTTAAPVPSTPSVEVGATASAATTTSVSTNGATTTPTTPQGVDGTAASATHPTTLSSSNSLETLANIKEKTTMCLVNELARYNKIQHQYRLTGESGPAHKKRFTVTLKLGDEEYTAEGASIKKAQHKAAGDAIAETKYKHPPARTKPRAKTGPRGNVSSFTPTVELNALAMKRGEPTVYQVKAVPLPMPKYPSANPGGMPGTGVVAGGPGRRPDKLPPQAAQGLGVGYGGRHVHPNGGGDWGRGAPGGMVGVVAGVGGRGGMGGFHPGHQQQQHPPHHPRTAGGSDEQHHGLYLVRLHPNQLHHHAHHHHEGPAGGHPPGGGSSVMPAQEFYMATLRVGERTFLGEGHSPQAARHDAAARALEVLKPLTAEAAANDGKGKATIAGGGDGEANGDDAGSDGDPNAELKSPISLVHEMAVQRNVPVVFEVISEKGPPHMTVFVTQCKVGTIVTEGEGTGKKPSKKRAAEKMLEELRKLQKAEQQHSSAGWGGGDGACEKRKTHSKSSAAAAAAANASQLEAGVVTAKKKARNLIKEKSVTGGDVAGEKENPISRLMQIQQARKEKQPVYVVVENERPNVGRRRQFTIEVYAAGKKATGVGMTKKAAKWNAAEALLVDLGYATATTTMPTATKSPAAANGTANKENQSGAANEAPTVAMASGGRKVTFTEGSENVALKTTTNGTDSRSPLGGANQGKLRRGDTSRDAMNDSTASNDSMATNSSGVSSASSVPALTTVSSSPSAPSNPDIGRKKEQLLYLAQLLKFEVQFSDFPKGNHGEYLTLVILSTEPPQLCHGSGASLKESHDEAARGALEILSKIGLDNVKPKAATPSSNTATDTTDVAGGK
ncbi:double-stranded RNA-binding protein Staufen homolog [Anopheles ziemanni]|uniref:double-stranded RNA-binding protein Staufen homolog n=1 Tax=Anopheles ziemanni TaxID=345580 RepID=UPI00265D75C8|nr:double-stranded RNA-binding protein Staufen homolog [Anopheles ziemanni]